MNGWAAAAQWIFKIYEGLKTAFHSFKISHKYNTCIWNNNNMFTLSNMRNKYHEIGFDSLYKKITVVDLTPHIVKTKHTFKRLMIIER